jgi:hypothetical protein
MTRREFTGAALVLSAIAILIGFGVGRVTARHDLNAERRARCAAEVALELVHSAPARFLPAAGPDAACEDLTALREERR